MNPDDLYDIVYIQGRCPQCGSKVEELDKDTGSGRDIQYFHCFTCDWNDSIDVEMVLWKALSSSETQPPEGTERPSREE